MRWWGRRRRRRRHYLTAAQQEANQRAAQEAAQRADQQATQRAAQQAAQRAAQIADQNASAAAAAIAAAEAEARLAAQRAAEAAALLAAQIAAAEAIEAERVRQNSPCTSITQSWTFPNSTGPMYTVRQNGYSIPWSNLHVTSNANMSVSFLLKITSLYPTARNIFHITNSNNTSSVPSCSIAPNDTSINIINSTVDNASYSLSADTLGLNNTIFVTITWNNRTIRYYINGILSETYPVDKFIDAVPNATLYIGDPWYEQNGGILIKNFSIYNCCLSPSNITTIYGNNSNMFCSYTLSSTELDCYKNNYPIDLSTMNPQQLQTHWSNIGCKDERNNQCPSQQTSSGLYNYKGCYNDTSIKSIPTKLSNVMSIDECATLAENNSKNVFGLQNNGECWTGLNEQEAYQYGINFNKYSCPEMGGSNTNQVYVRQEIFPSPPPSVPYLTKPNFAYKENFSNMLDEENKNQKTNYSILIIIIILIFMILIFLPILYK